MKGRCVIIIILILAFYISGCYSKEASIIWKGIEIQPTKLSPGSRVLFCETTPGVATYEIKKFRRDVKLSELFIVDPPPTKYKGFLLPEIVKKMADDMNVDMIFVAFVQPTERRYVRTKEKQYKETKQELKEKEDVLLLTIFDCVVYQYNGRGQLIGRTHFTKEFPERITCPCPLVLYDGTEYFE